MTTPVAPHAGRPTRANRSIDSARWPSGRPAALPDPAVQAWRGASFPDLGTVRVGAGAAGVLAIELVDAGLAALGPVRSPAARPVPGAAVPPGESDGDASRLAERTLGEIVEYLAGARKAFTVPVDLACLPPFSRRVLEAVARIPWGGATTYGALARAIGCPGGARAVGQALGRNPVPLLVPCHRVLAGGGLIGGFSCGLDWKRRLLRMEAIAWREPRAD